jgi:hypothetical protein
LTTKKYLIMLSLIILVPNCVIREAFWCIPPTFNRRIETIMGGWSTHMRCKSIQWWCSFQHACDFVMDNAQSTSLWHSSWMCGERVSRMSNLQTQHNDTKVTSIMEKCILCPKKEVVANGTCFWTSRIIIWWSVRRWCATKDDIWWNTQCGCSTNNMVS